MPKAYLTGKKNNTSGRKGNIHPAGKRAKIPINTVNHIG